MMRFVSLATKKLKWTDEYAIEKILPIACRTQLSVKIERQLCTTEGNKADARAEETEFVFEPVSLTKRRVASGISCFNVLWKKTKVHCGTENACPENMIPESYESCEPECLLVKSYPNLVEQFEQVESAKKKTKIRKPKVKKNVPNQTKAQKPITQFFVQAKESCRERKETLSENKGSTKNMCSKNDVNSRSLAVIDKNPLGNILQEKKIDGNTHNSNASHKAIVTPAVERTKRELLRKIFEESPDPRNCFALNEKYDSSKFKENKPLQSTPIQVIYYAINSLYQIYFMNAKNGVRGGGVVRWSQFHPTNNIADNTETSKRFHT